MGGMRHQSLVDDIDKFRAEFGVAEYTFGLYAVRNGRLMERLRGGGRIWPETEEPIRRWMRTETIRRRSLVDA
jgi:hypothetical protein